MIATRRSLVLVTIVALSALSACGAPLQNGGVEVLPGAEERLEAMCRYGSLAQQKVCAGPLEGEAR